METASMAISGPDTELAFAIQKKDSTVEEIADPVT
jgi:hypothetical protein